MDLKGMTFGDLRAWVKGQGESPYRAQQLFTGLHGQQLVDLMDLSTLPLSLRRSWQGYIETPPLRKLKELQGLDGTHKFLFQLQDGEEVETVYMPHHHHTSLCISTQVGCAMGCRFCASGKGGLRRNLTTGEIVEQIYTVERELKVTISNLLFMGIGEPLANMKGLLKALSILNHPLGHGISMRHMVISTCGLVPRIYSLAQQKLQVLLAISLHASINEKRDKIMPINHLYPLEELLKACSYYIKETKRRITFEYILLGGFNDDLQDVISLAQLLKGINSHINLIPCNKAIGGFSPPNQDQVDFFYQELLKRVSSVTLRKARGLDIGAACGQLRISLKD